MDAKSWRRAKFLLMGFLLASVGGMLIYSLIGDMTLLAYQAIASGVSGALMCFAAMMELRRQRAERASKNEKGGGA